MSAGCLVHSEMDFSPCSKHPMFDIEAAVKDVFKKSTPRSVEFVYFDEGKKELRFVEAKRSGPRMDSGGDADKYLNKLVEKIISSILFVVGMNVERNDAHHSLPSVMLDMDVSEIKIIFIVVIKTHEKEWLEDVSRLLSRRLASYFTAFNINAKCQYVINEDMARHLGVVA